MKMCGITFYVSKSPCPNALERLKTLKKRGPDTSSLTFVKNYTFGQTRLCVTGVLTQDQPIRHENYLLIFNGAIYNGREEGMEIIKVVKKHGMTADAVQALNGIFAFVLVDIENEKIFISRDRCGVIPLYYVETDDFLFVASEMKACYNLGKIRIFPPGCYVNKTGLHRYHKWSSKIPDVIMKPDNNFVYNVLYDAVERQMQNVEVPYGILLSGGLDSAIIGSLASEASSNMYFPSLHTFSIGLEGSEDLKYAHLVAANIDSMHHEIIFTVEEAISCLPDVIEAIETYDVTTVRASVPMYLLGKSIKRYGIKVVYSGEGSDELFGGYLYNWYCSNPEDMQKECALKMSRLHYHDCARANKSMAVHGIETRVPFLDNKVTDWAMNILDPKEKLSKMHASGPKAEKWFLRNAFKDHFDDAVRLREKVQFSDGVGSAWIDGIKEYAEKTVQHVPEYTFQAPHSKEAALYRQIFYQKFPEVNFSNADKTVLYTPNSAACSSEEAFHWHKFKADPSGNQLSTGIK